MIALLSRIAEIIITLVTLVINTLTSFINLLTHMGSYSTFVISTINTLPAVLIPFATASISLYVVLFILGRR